MTMLDIIGSAFIWAMAAIAAVAFVWMWIADRYNK